jgi:hypothetical protein
MILERDGSFESVTPTQLVPIIATIKKIIDLEI